MATDFGTDVSCAASLRTGRLVSGALLVAEAAFRRLTTPRGMLRGGPDEQNYGIDLVDIIGASNPRLAAAALPGQIRMELLKDERITDATATVTVVSTLPATELDILIEITTDAGPFTLKLSVNDVTVSLLGLAA